MGSRKKSKNNSVSTNAAQMAALQPRANPAATLGQMLGAQQGMQNNMLKDVMGTFNQMKQAGDAQMSQNPMQALISEMMGMGQMSTTMSPARWICSICLDLSPRSLSNNSLRCRQRVCPDTTAAAYSAV